MTQAIRNQRKPDVLSSGPVPEDVSIRFDKVYKAFGTKKVLNGLSLDVKRGEALILMGPSGTGKSVTLRHAIGLLTQDSGDVWVEGHDMARITAPELFNLRKRMGYLFQEGALINWMSVADNVALPLVENSDLSPSEVEQRVREKLDLVHLEGVWSEMPSEISGGMKKRVGLARALITEPELILYDEPNAGLDPEISQSINHLIREVSDTLGITSMVITHMVSCVRTVADRVVLLDEGKVIVDAAPDDFLNHDHPRLRRFLGQDPD
ncbi:MAG: ATP-binding cassette domain-containing protein [Planctomycetota bacterium]|nr:ATP-binding cassette domain-containing protein [Planctomycetota bacterium]MDG2143481.1 ATP-binding cassette domain-containing protein [Planctomycetota bacterium]